jgi:CBS domain-containing protein
VKLAQNDTRKHFSNRRSKVKTIKVKDIMVPIEEYATVEEGATLGEALMALESAQKHQAADRYKHRAVLVYGKKGDIVGKISQLDLIKGLERGYTYVEDLQKVSYSGYTRNFLKSMAQKHNLWSEPLKDICRKGSTLKAKDIMYKPVEGEYVDANASLDEAIHQLVMGRHQSLLVTEKSKITGILRLTDVFAEICDAMKTCQP